MGSPLRPKGGLTALSVADKASVMPALEDRWTQNAFYCQQRLSEALERNDHNAGKAWAWAGGVSTDKVIKLKEGPTAPIVHLHAHRHELGPLFDRLAAMRPVARAQIIEHKGIATNTSTSVEY